MPAFRIENRCIAPATFNQLRQLAGWGALDEKMVEAGLRNSVQCWCALTGDEVVGFVRLVGDGVLNLSVEELLVHPDHRRRGIAQALMEALMTYVRSLPTGCTINLMAAPEITRFYEKFGFRVRPPERPGMQIRL